jgi:hypothetical protein
MTEKKYSESAEKRNTLVHSCMSRLQNFAYRGVAKGLKNTDFVVVCIKVDSPWRYIVDALMPNHDWEKYRLIGEEPIARGSAMFSLCEVLAEKLPNIKQALLEIPTENKVKLIALDEGGCTVYDIDPKPEQKN